MVVVAHPRAVILRAPRVPYRAGNHGEQWSVTGFGNGNGLRPSYLVRGRSTCAVGVGFEPTVTGATTIFRTVGSPLPAHQPCL